MEKKTFLGTWKEIPAANEIQYTVDNVECTSDGISTKMGQNNVSTECVWYRPFLTFYSGIYCCQAHPWGAGHDLPVSKAEQWYLGPGGDQAVSWQPKHHPGIQVQGHGDCSGSVPGTLFKNISYHSQCIWIRSMKPFFTTENLVDSIQINLLCLLRIWEEKIKKRKSVNK